MSRILETEIRKLENKMLSLSALVGENVHKAVKACQLRDVDLAREVIAADSDVDRMEVELEEDCLKVLALHQPVAVDLRFIVAILKINNDLERIGDCAAKIAQRAKTLASCSEAEHPFDLGEMAQRAWSMVHDSLEALVQTDTARAQRVRAADAEVDAMHHRNWERLKAAIKRDPAGLDRYIAYRSLSGNLERISDHATNIAEDVVYLLEGAIVRHDGGASVPDARAPVQSMPPSVAER